jgi:acyl carrier protein
MTVIRISQDEQTTANEDSVVIEKVRALIAKHFDVDINRVTDDAHFSRDFGADWLDRLELIILVEETAGLEIADQEADLIEVVGDLVCYIDRRRSVMRPIGARDRRYKIRQPDHRLVAG